MCLVPAEPEVEGKPQAWQGSVGRGRVGGLGGADGTQGTGRNPLSRVRPSKDIQVQS